ncbi:MAG: VOC family protein [Rhodobacteraceae bacterium]|nr:VOC family protein [Paracoccaceae bacterium]
MAHLEHVNVTVADPKATAAVLIDLFDWHIRWEGPSMTEGYTVHVGDKDSYVALFAKPGAQAELEPGASYGTRGGLNHIGIVVGDIDEVERRVKRAGYTPTNHGDYEPGRRFYFDEANGVEIEVISYP